MPRLGEAQNPGPRDHEARVFTANLTSAGGGWSLIRDLPWSVALLQETRQRQDSEARADARRRGWQVIPGERDADGRDLVWIVAKEGAISEVKLGLGPRAVGAVWSPGGPTALRLYNIYGQVDRRAEAKAETSELVRACVEEAESQGQCPALVGGDLNTTTEELECAADLAVSGWADLSAEPTCATGTAKLPRRIDVLLSNRQLQWRAGAVEIDWCTGLAVHATQAFRVELGRAPMVLQWRPKKLPMEEEKASREEAWDKAAVVAAQQWGRLQSDDPDEVFEALEAVIAEYHHARHGESKDLIQRGGEAKWGRREPRQHDGTAETAEAAACGRRWRRLVELAKMWPPVGPIGKNAYDILEALRKTEKNETVWKEKLSRCADKAGVTSLVAAAVEDYSKARAADRSARRSRWRKWVRETIRTQPGRVWTWVREGARPTQFPTAVHTTEGGEEHQEMRQLRGVEDWWWGLWGSHTEPQWSELHGYLGVYKEFSEYQAGVDWDRGSVGAVFAKMANKAPGPDGRVAKELRDWPPPLLDLVARLYRAVEQAGRWPETLRHAMVAMLPKKGTGARDDYRPITLLTVLYRAWARAHSDGMRSWLRANQVARQKDLVGADIQAYELALQLAWGRREGTPVSGVAIDWSKCYDNISLDLIPVVSKAAGLPQRVWRPVLDMYRAPRSVLMNGCISRPRVPTHGITAGCPLAGEVLALIAHMLVRALRDLGPEVRARPYVDDLTASTTGGAGASATVAKIWDVVGTFGHVMRWSAATTKCARFSTSKDVRRQLCATPGPPVQDVFLDLGVAQHTTGSRDTTAAHARDLKALQKMSRVRTLQLDFKWRCRMVASSGLPTALYGLESHPASDERLRVLRSAAFEAIWKSGNRSAIEIVVSIHAPWRADPGAVAIVQPLVQLVKALRAEIVTTRQLDELLEAGDTVGPIAAVAGAIRRGKLQYLGHGRLQIGQEVVPLAETPRAQLTLQLVAQHRLIQVQEAARRRASHRGFHDGVDVEVTLKHQRCGSLKPATMACLRLLQAGGAMTQDIAAVRLGRGTAECPHCGQGEETLEHRLHNCHRWDKVRTDAIGDKSWEDICRQVPRPTLLTGLMPRNPALEEIRRSAEAAARWPDTRTLEGRVWTDGSAIHNDDPLLARAGWAVVARVNGALVEVAGGRVPGRQTSGRAELCALVWVSRCPGEAVMVTDNRSVQQGAARCSPGAPEDLCEGRNGDLWALVRRRVHVQWIKSHMDWPQAEARGFTREDFDGNHVADEAAGRWAMTAAPPEEVVADRKNTVAAVLAYQKVVASVQEASMDTTHARAHRRRLARRPIVGLIRRRAKAPQKQPLRKQVGPRPPVVHDLCLEQGPPAAQFGRAAGAQQGRPGGGRGGGPHHHWRMQCQTCGRAAHHTSAWGKLANSLCLASEAARACTRRVATHEVVRCAGGWACLRCGLTGTARRRAAMTRARCPIRGFYDATGEAIPHAVEWTRYHFGLSAAWRGWAAGRPIEEELTPPSRRVGQGAAMDELGRLLGLRWTPHWIVGSRGREVCLRCGSGPHKQGAQELKGRPCPALRPIRAAAAVLIRAGVFADALRDAPYIWRAKVDRDLGAR